MYFITGNKNKFAEVQAILPQVEQLDLDLPEIQEMDAKEIIKAKLLEALKHHSGELIVEDTSLYFDCLHGFPGPLIKWFRKTLTNEGLADLVAKFENNRAQAKTIIGYARSAEEIYFFEGVVEGRIVAPSGNSDFGWDPIFLPDGYDKTFAELTAEEKNQISMRRLAVNRLKEFLNSR